MKNGKRVAIGIRPPAELFLLSATNPASFDSRYLGPIPAATVIGSAQPLWTWDTR